MNEQPNHRFEVQCKIVFTTQQGMDEFDAQQHFEQELSKWEGMRSDLDFESVQTNQVVELPADNDEYNMLNMKQAVEGIAKAAKALRDLEESDPASA